MSSPAHRIRPLKGGHGTSRHLLVWCQTVRDERPGPRNATGVRLEWVRPRLLILDKLEIKLGVAAQVPALQWDLDECLDSLPPAPRYTLWFPRGWHDFVLSGMSAIVDRGDYEWRSMVIDGARLSARGLWRGRAMDLAALANWTGSAWDGWRAKVLGDNLANVVRQAADHARRDGWPIETEELVALSTLESILTGVHCLGCGEPAGSAGVQGRRWWRAWGGPLVNCRRIERKGAHGKRVETKECYVAPLPGRHPAAAAAERHCCYGMAREQYFRGRVDGPVHVLDLRSAYLLALSHTACPTIFAGRCEARSGAELLPLLDHSTGLALCHVESPDTPYPVRRGPRVGRAVGSYWTWLAGDELAWACQRGHVLAIHSAWKWYATCPDHNRVHGLLAMADKFKSDGLSRVCPVWRAVYSACVGGFAQRDRRWVDARIEHPFGRWASWEGTAPETGEWTRWRCIAGRSQYLESSTVDSRAVPMVYACVLATLRSIMDELRREAGPGNVVAQSADALWLAEGGADRILNPRRQEFVASEAIRYQAVYDTVWLDGHGAAVVQADGQRFAVRAGVPGEEPVDADGRVHWRGADPWSAHPEGPRQGTLYVRERTFGAEQFVARWDHPAEAVNPWWPLEGGEMAEELLLPLEPRERKVPDEGA